MSNIVLFKKPDKSTKLKFKFDKREDLVEITDHFGSTVKLTISESEDIFHAIFHKNRPKFSYKH